jgi:hypothetical protein
MDMQLRLAVLSLVLAAGCASDVDLELDREAEASSSIGVLRSARVFAGSGDLRVMGTAWHPASLVIAGGDFSGTTDLGTGPVSHDGYRAGFAAAYDAATGEPVWSRVFAGSAATDVSYHVTHSGVMDVAIAFDGTFLAAGSFGRTVDFGTGPIESTDGCDDGVIARYTDDGDPLEPFVLPRSPLYAVAAMPDGGLVTCGYEVVAACPWLDGGGAPNQGFVARLSPAGEVLWKHHIGPQATATAVATTAAGDVLVHGVFSGRAAVGDLALDDGTGADMFIARISADGQPRWLRGCIAGSLESSCSHDAGFAVRGERVFMVANALGEVAFAGQQIPALGAYQQMFLAELDDNGEAQIVMVSDAAVGRSIAVRAEPFEIVVSGDGNADGAAAGPYVGVLAGGTTLVSQRGMSIPPLGWGQAWDVAVGPGGELAVVGAFHGNADFGDGPVRAETDEEDEGDDGFLAIYDRDVVELR